MAAEENQSIYSATADSSSDNDLVTEYLHAMPSLMARGVFYALLLIFIAALVFAYIVKVDIVVKGQAVARPLAGIHKILADRDGYIAKVFIAEGQVVEKNTPLFLLRSQASISSSVKVDELQKIIPLKEQFYNTKIAIAEEQQTFIEKNYRNKLEESELKQKRNKLTLDSLELEISFRKLEIERWTRQVDYLKKMLDRGAVSVNEYNEGESRLRTTELDHKKSQADREIAVKDKEIIDGEITAIKSTYQKEKSINKSEIANLEREKESTLENLRSELKTNSSLLAVQNGYAAPEANNQAAGNMILASQAGTVLELFFKNNGDYIKTSDLLCTLVPSGSPLYMDISVSNADIGLIRDGMEIKYKFDAFPYMDYGVLAGDVASIAPSAIQKEGTTNFVYQVRGNLKQNNFLYQNKDYPVKAGMTAIAELVTERKTILACLLKGLKR